MFLALAIAVPVLTFLAIRLAVPEMNEDGRAFSYLISFLTLFDVVLGWILARRVANVDFARFGMDRTLRFTNASYQREFDHLNLGTPISRSSTTAWGSMIGFLRVVFIAALAGVPWIFVNTALPVDAWLAELGATVGMPHSYRLSQGVVFGLLPALFATGFSWNGSRPYRRRTLALCVLLGIAAGLLTCSLPDLVGGNAFWMAHSTSIGVMVVLSPAVSALLARRLLRAGRE